MNIEIIEGTAPTDVERWKTALEQLKQIALNGSAPFKPVRLLVTTEEMAACAREHLEGVEVVVMTAIPSPSASPEASPDLQPKNLSA